jgi:hypothetical protein
VLGVLNSQSVGKLPKQILNSEEPQLEPQRLSSEGVALRRIISQRNEIIGIEFEQYVQLGGMVGDE